MDEWLAIRIEKPGKWRDQKPDEAQCIKDLKPRSTEDKKSAWGYAHVEDALIDKSGLQLAVAIRVGRASELLGRDAARAFLRKLRPHATRQLQALALLLFHTRANGPTLSDVCFLSINRSALDADIAADETAEHIIEAYDWTHRGLATKDANARLRTVKKLLGSDYNRSRIVYAYTVDELKPLLSGLLKARLLRSEYVEAATAILAVAP